MDDRRNHQPELRKRYHAAISTYNEGDYGRAADAFGRIATQRGLYAVVSRFYASESHLQLGLQYMRQHKIKEAIRSFELATSFNRNHDRLPQFLACCFAQLGDYATSARHSDRETSLRPKKSDPRIRLALSLWRDGQQEQAIMSLRDGVLDQPEQVAWHFQLGVLLSAQEQYEEAIAALEQALSLDPEHYESYTHLALCHGAVGDPQAAVAHLTRAQRLRPQDAKIGLYLAMALNAQAAPAQQTPHLSVPVAAPAIAPEAVEELIQLVDQEPEVIEAFVTLPEIESETDTFALLSAVIERMLTTQPRRAELHYQQALLYRRMGRSDDAIACCERAVEINPRLVQALVTLGKLYQETDRTQHAAARLQQVIEMGFEYADVYYLLGCAYRDQGDCEQAKRSYEKALQINAAYQAAREALASVAA